MARGGCYYWAMMMWVSTERASGVVLQEEGHCSEPVSLAPLAVAFLVKGVRESVAARVVE